MQLFTDIETTEPEFKLSDEEVKNNFKIINKKMLNFIKDGFEIFEGYKKYNLFNFYKKNKSILKGDKILEIEEMKQKMDNFFYVMENNGDFINLYNNKNQKGAKDVK